MTTNNHENMHEIPGGESMDVGKGRVEYDPEMISKESAGALAQLALDDRDALMKIPLYALFISAFCIQRYLYQSDTGDRIREVAEEAMDFFVSVLNDQHEGVEAAFAELGSIYQRMNDEHERGE